MLIYANILYKIGYYADILESSWSRCILEDTLDNNMYTLLASFVEQVRITNIVSRSASAKPTTTTTTGITTAGGAGTEGISYNSKSLSNSQKDRVATLAKRLSPRSPSSSSSNNNNNNNRGSNSGSNSPKATHTPKVTSKSKSSKLHRIASLKSVDSLAASSGMYVIHTIVCYHIFTNIYSIVSYARILICMLTDVRVCVVKLCLSRCLLYI